VLLRSVIRTLKQAGRDVAITAPTGIAGVNIGGVTIYSWAGIGLGKQSADRLITSLSKAQCDRWVDIHTLIIDEISMLDGALFDKLASHKYTYG
jgi:ATP-dependent DNA helicase PIF1